MINISIRINNFKILDSYNSQYLRHLLNKDFLTFLSNIIKTLNCIVILFWFFMPIFQANSILIIYHFSYNMGWYNADF